jgi:hypothetical protein
VRVQNAQSSREPTTWAFNVESIQIPVAGARIIGLIVEVVYADLKARNIISPSNVMIDSALGIVGASNLVLVSQPKLEPKSSLPVQAGHPEWTRAR